ncbi:MAG: hypothetical protein JXB29_07005 [Sedimentisphaerales bacterium]|nr:hypothetical protein [Sedimentisphaerales bacterium]
MNNRLFEKISPICKFGPGGDFVTLWMPEWVTPLSRSPNFLRKMFNLLDELTDAVFAGEYAKNLEEFIPAQGCINQKADPCEKKAYASPNSFTACRGYCPSITNMKTHRLLLEQKLLFADNGRINISNGHKPKHRIGTHHRTPRKRHAFNLSRECTLFEVDSKNARTA